MNIKTLEQTTKEDVSLVGGKGASLGIMSHAGIPIPPGFIITTEVYKNFVNKPIPSNIQNEILQSFDSLGAERVAVRSSAIAEDSTTSSWAGQLETYLNVTKDNLIKSIKKCWASMQSERAKAYAQKQGLADNQQIAVVVQKMINSEISGVMFTVNPVTKNRDEIMLEAGFGLGELLVQGLITPNNFILDKHTLEIKSKDIKSQDTMLVFQDGENKELSVSEDKRNEQVISNAVVKELAEIGKKIEDYCLSPQDIEWTMDSQSKIWILQSRPITTL